MLFTYKVGERDGEKLKKKMERKFEKSKRAC